MDEASKYDNIIQVTNVNYEKMLKQEIHFAYLVRLTLQNQRGKGERGARDPISRHNDALVETLQCQVKYYSGRRHVLEEYDAGDVLKIMEDLVFFDTLNL